MLWHTCICIYVCICLYVWNPFDLLSDSLTSHFVKAHGRPTLRATTLLTQFYVEIVFSDQQHNYSLYRIKSAHIWLYLVFSITSSELNGVTYVDDMWHKIALRQIIYRYRSELKYYFCTQTIMTYVCKQITTPHTDGYQTVTTAKH